MLDSIEEGRLRWYGHVMRMGEDAKEISAVEPMHKERDQWVDPEGDCLTSVQEEKR